MLLVHVMMRGQRGNRSIERLKFEEGSFFRCGTGEWISVIAKCDTVIDCLDASDEINCDSLTIGRLLVSYAIPFVRSNIKYLFQLILL